MTALQHAAMQYAQAGWKVSSFTDEHFVATRKRPNSGAFWAAVLIGLFFGIVPGLIILLLGIAAREDETVILTASEAENRLLLAEERGRHSREETERYRHEEENRLAARAQRVGDATGLSRFWRSMDWSGRAAVVFSATLSLAMVALFLFA